MCLVWYRPSGLDWWKQLMKEEQRSQDCLNIKMLCYMMTSSNGNIFRVTGPLCGEFTGPGEFPTQRPVTRSFDVFFDVRLNKRLSKQPRGWWFETQSWSLWRHCNDQYGDLHYKDEMVSWPSYLYHRNPITWKNAIFIPKLVPVVCIGLMASDKPMSEPLLTNTFVLIWHH